MSQYPKTAKLLFCALFAALTAVCSFISIPLPFTPVPVNLATLSVFLAGGVLGGRYGAASQTVYLALGAFGAPVFHNFTGGFGILAGPTGGYIIGYIAASFLTGFIMERGKGTLSWRLLLPAMIAGLAACYLLGTIWFMLLTGAGPAAALASCVIPFLPGDGLKILAAGFLIKKLRPILQKSLI